MTTFHRTANPSNASYSGLAAFRSTHPKTMLLSSLASRFVSICSITVSRRQITWISVTGYHFRCWRFYHQRIKYIASLLTIISVGTCNDRP
jgi:hypothetical protein